MISRIFVTISAGVIRKIVRMTVFKVDWPCDMQPAGAVPDLRPSCHPERLGQPLTLPGNARSRTPPGSTILARPLPPNRGTDRRSGSSSARILSHQNPIRPKALSRLVPATRRSCGCGTGRGGRAGRVAPPPDTRETSATPRMSRDLSPTARPCGAFGSHARSHDGSASAIVPRADDERRGAEPRP